MNQSPLQWQARGVGIADLMDDAQQVRVTIDARGGGRPIRIGHADAWFEIDVPGDGELPPSDEQYVRGQTLHIMYPQSSEQFAVRLAIEPIHWVDQSDGGDLAETIVLECRMSVQTDLLHSHPTLDVVAGGVSDSAAATILLSHHDRPHTTISDPKRVTLFGEFLEKGVIRKAQPWFVFAAQDAQSQLKFIEQQQSHREVMLTD